MIINHNMNAMNAHRNMSTNTINAGKSMEKLSSGLRINKAGDDAAGLAISEKMRGQIRGLDQASRNSQDGISMIQTAEGALNETHSILQRMRELAVQGANDANDADSRTSIQTEMNQLTSEINRIGNTTEFNTQKLLKGSATGTDAEAMKTASDAIGATNAVDFSALAPGALSVNGVAVGLDNLLALDGTDGTDGTDGAGGDAGPQTIAQVKTALQNDLNAVFDGSAHGGVTFTVGDDGNGKLTIESSVQGTQSKVDLSGSTTAITDALGFRDTTAVNGSTAKFEADLQIGANKDQSFTIEINDMRAEALGISSSTALDTTVTNGTGSNSATATLRTINEVTDGTSNVTQEKALDITTHDNATAAIKVIDNAINSVSAERSKLGAYQNRLEHTINNLGTSSENLTSAESRIRDVDMAKEMMSFSKNNILSQAAQAMLAQANSQPQGVLQLLR